MFYRSYLCVLLLLLYHVANVFDIQRPEVLLFVAAVVAVIKVAVENTTNNIFTYKVNINLLNKDKQEMPRHATGARADELGTATREQRLWLDEMGVAAVEGRLGSTLAKEYVTRIVPALILLTVLLYGMTHLKASAVPPPRALHSLQPPPTMVWFTTCPWITENTLITCPSENHTLRCEVFTDRRESFETRGYLFYSDSIRAYPLPRNDDIWAIMFSESPYTREEVMHEKYWNLFNVTATFNRHSDVPFPLAHLPSLEFLTASRYFIHTSLKNSFLPDKAPVVYLQSNCGSWTARDEYVQELMKFIKVDSYGTCVHNKDLPYNLTFRNMEFFDPYSPELMEILSGYKFMLVIENAVCHDYISEKLWRALGAGTVPVYYGSPTIRDWLPNEKSAILLEDHPTPLLLAKYLQLLMKNDTMYEEHLEHKTFQRVTNKRLLEELRLRPQQGGAAAAMQLQCAVCELLHMRNAVPHTPRVATVRHAQCLPPSSTLTLAADHTNPWMPLINQSQKKVDMLYDLVRTYNGSHTHISI